MDSSRRDDDASKPGEAPGRPEEDREAILSRRKFLIESALASAGITLGVAGCGPSKETTPEVCLRVAPQKCLKMAPPRAPDGGMPQVCLSRPRPCLSVAPKKPSGKICLDF